MITHLGKSQAEGQEDEPAKGGPASFFALHWSFQPSFWLFHGLPVDPSHYLMLESAQTPPPPPPLQTTPALCGAARGHLHGSSCRRGHHACSSCWRPGLLEQHTVPGSSLTQQVDLLLEGVVHHAERPHRWGLAWACTSRKGCLRRGCSRACWLRGRASAPGLSWA